MTVSRRKIVEISNELEFGLSGVSAKSLMRANEARGYRLDLAHEVNPRDAIELRVSKALSITELNRRVSSYVDTLVRRAEALGGRPYGGGMIFSDISDLEPMRFRTTSLSETAARAFMEIGSQQVVIGVNDERLGFDLYNFFRNISPALLALSANSPYEYGREGRLGDTEHQSARVAVYRSLLRRFPMSMVESPYLGSMEDYHNAVRSVSEEIRARLDNGSLDANWTELNKIRQNGNGSYSYYPFGLLEPHQVFWFTRPRPDFVNDVSAFALEVRVPDMPTKVSGVQALNSLVVGLAYYIAKNGEDAVPRPFNGSFADIMTAGREGLGASINGVRMADALRELARYAAMGLRREGYGDEASRLDNVDRMVSDGGGAEAIRRLMRGNGYAEPRAALIQHLSSELRG